MNDIQRVRAARRIVWGTSAIQWHTVKRVTGLNDAQVKACLYPRLDPLYVAIHFPALTPGMSWDQVRAVLGIAGGAGSVPCVGVVR